MRLHTVIGLALGAGLIGPAAQAQGASFQGLGDLPGGSVNSQANGVSADGAIIVGGDISAVAEAFRWTQTSGITGLGDLPGGQFASVALDISADGSVIVGGGQAADGGEAFRWTQAGGMVGLGDLPGGDFGSSAYGASHDGSVVVGSSESANPREAFRWTQAGGMAPLGDLPGGSFDSVALDVSADGNVVVGLGAGPNGSEAFRWAQPGGMVGLGDLPGGGFFSVAYAVSVDGSVVVGRGASASGPEAFRWTLSGGMVGLGDLPGGVVSSIAYDVSADGNVVVGTSGMSPQEAFIWTSSEGMQNLRDVLIAAGVNMTGWTLMEAQAVSADGQVIVGWGLNPSGQTEAWRALVPRMSVTAPTAGDLVIGGERTRVRFRGPGGPDLLELYLLPDTLGAPAQLIAFSLAPTDTSYAWTVPDTVFSRSARLVLRVMTDPTVADTSAYFRIKPYHLTRLAANGSRYDPFLPSRHGWSFANSTANLFPPAWYTLPAFNYTVGLDPFTGVGYDDDFDQAPIGGYVGAFPDWPAFVRAFGPDAAYSLIIPNVEGWYRPMFKAAWGRSFGSPGPSGTNHIGSCFGLAASSLLAFTHREAFGTRYPDIGPVAQLFGLPLTVPARETANELYSHQFGVVNVATTVAALRSTDPRRVLSDLKALFGQDDAPAQQRNITIYQVTNCTPLTTSGAHTMTPFRLQRDSGGPGRWRIDLYDNNSPGDNTNSFIRVDSTLNTWTFVGSLAWGGSCGMILEDRIENYLNLAEPFRHSSTTRLGGDSLHVAVAPAADVTLASAAGAVGHAGEVPFNTIPGALPLVPKVGGPAMPDTYILPPGAYTLTIDNPVASRQTAWFDDGQLRYGYGRADADASHLDRVRYDPAGGLTALSTDAGVTKHVTLRVVLPPAGDVERSIDAADLTLIGADSVSFETVAGGSGPRMRLQNRGGAKTYALRLLQTDASGGARFRHVAVPLPAGATHTARPDWATLGSGPVEVDVDLNGDGIPDEVLVLENQPVANEPGTGGRPTELALHAPAPNPGAGQIALRFDLPSEGHVRLVLHDMLGRQVAVLVDESRGVGAHTLALDTGRFAPGTYLLRLEASAQSRVQRLTIAR